MVSFDTTALLQMLGMSADSLRLGLVGLDDDEIATASALPDWSRGHVLTHLARNADALVNLLNWARTGVETPMYASREVRDGDIAEGANRRADEHRADFEESQARFVKVAEQLSDADWRASIQWGRDGRPDSADIIPWLRLVEIEVHHVDLDVGYTPAHWSTTFVRTQLARTVEDRSLRDDTPMLTLKPTDDDAEHVLGDGRGPTVSGPQAALLAWLIGRSAGPGIVVQGGGSLPGLAPWR